MTDALPALRGHSFTLIEHQTTCKSCLQCREKISSLAQTVSVKKEFKQKSIHCFTFEVILDWGIGLMLTLLNRNYTSEHVKKHFLALCSLCVAVLSWSMTYAFTHVLWRIFSSFFHPHPPSLKAQIQAPRPKYHPQGPNVRLKAPILASWPPSQPWGRNPSLKPHIPAQKPKSHLLGKRENSHVKAKVIDPFKLILLRQSRSTTDHLNDVTLLRAKE